LIPVSVKFDFAESLTVAAIVTPRWPCKLCGRAMALQARLIIFIISSTKHNQHNIMFTICYVDYVYKKLCRYSLQ